MQLQVNVIPKSPEYKVVKFDRGGLDVQVIQANPGGITNDRLVTFLSIVLEYPEGDIKVISGQEGADKKVYIRGLSEGDLVSRLGIATQRSVSMPWEEEGVGKDKSKKRSVRSKKRKRTKSD